MTSISREGRLRAELVRHLWTYERVGHDRRAMRFLPDGTIGRGQAALELHWRIVTDEEDCPRLQIGDERRETCRLRRTERGDFEGRWLVFEQMPVRLLRGERVPIDVPEVLASAETIASLTSALLEEACPMSQNASAGNLGFGYTYYDLVRNLRPDAVVVIGSARGFAPLCAALGLQHNGWGRVWFVDPSYEGDGPPAWGGRGHWSDPQAVAAWFERFGLAAWVEHLRMTSREAIGVLVDRLRGLETRLVLIDGAHTLEDSLVDFEEYAGLVRAGYVLMHDSCNPYCDVSTAVEILRRRGHPMVTLTGQAGLTMIQVGEGTPPIASVRSRDYADRIFRRARLDELAECRAFLDGVFGEAEAETISGSYVAAGVLEELLERGQLFVLEDAAGGIGASGYLRTHGEVGWAGYIAVVRGLRGQGVGASLLACLEEQAVRNGCSECRLQILVALGELSRAKRRWIDQLGRSGYALSGASPVDRRTDVPAVFLEYRKSLA